MATLGDIFTTFNRPPDSYVAPEDRQPGLGYSELPRDQLLYNKLNPLIQQVQSGTPLTAQQRQALYSISDQVGSSRGGLSDLFIKQMRGQLPDQDLISHVMSQYQSVANPRDDTLAQIGLLGASAIVGGAAAGAGGTAAGSTVGDAGVYGVSGIESAAAPGLTYGTTGTVTAGVGGTTGSATLAGTAGADTLAATSGPGEWADLSSWLGADTTGAPAYDATQASINANAGFPGGTAGAGATGAVGGASASGGTAAAAAGGGGALSKILNGNGGPADYLDVLGRFAPAAFGAYGANQQANAYRDLGEKYLAVGAPSRARFESSFAPGFSMENEAGYKDALAQTTKETLHRLSPGGSPVGSPNAWQATLQDVNSKFAFPALNEYRRVNAGAGGLAALTSAAPAADSSAVNANKSVYDALGAGAADIFSPARSLSDLLREMKRAGY